MKEFMPASTTFNDIPAHLPDYVPLREQVEDKSPERLPPRTVPSIPQGASSAEIEEWALNVRELQERWFWEDLQVPTARELRELVDPTRWEWSDMAEWLLDY